MSSRLDKIVNVAKFTAAGLRDIALEPPRLNVIGYSCEFVGLTNLVYGMTENNESTSELATIGICLYLGGRVLNDFAQRVRFSKKLEDHEKHSEKFC